jgi:hypothetical protein
VKRLASLLLLLAAGLAGAGPEDAVVRVISHGASATVIHTEPGRTLLLGCAHAYRGGDRHKRHVIDAPAPLAGAKSTGGRIRVLAVDHRLDLSLVEIPEGPLPYVCPVAPAGHRPSADILSAGYDEMRVPRTERRATLAGSGPAVTYTREKPWHGRSGGALIDLRAGRLIGVVQGYEVPPGGGGRGIYASHDAVLRFLYGGLPRRAEASPGGFPGLALPCPGGT